MRMRRMIFGVAVGAAIGAGLPAWGAAISNIAFTAPTDYTNNFVGTLNGGTITYNSAGQNLLYNPPAVQQTAIIRYDTNPGDGQPGPADFLNETIKYDAALSAFDGSSAGIMTRMQSDGTAVLALLNANSATSLQIRLFFGAGSTTNGAGTQFYNGTFNLATGAVTGGGTGSTNAVAVNTPLTLTLTQTSAADPVFNLTIADADGFVASSGPQTLTSALSNAYDGPGSIALRVNTPTIGDTITLDNLSATPTPEPGTFALAGFAAMGLLVRRRRR
ncbi:MAG: hypothetical protein JWN40_2882 [Phycisphaerales bacterium]|nr:hypothetical protein [Phycisphaerales bacterium]